jgi:hypothetical protein
VSKGKGRRKEEEGRRTNARDEEEEYTPIMW